MSADDFYPELSEAGQEEAQRLIDKFKSMFRKAVDEVLGEIYCDVACHISSDSWTNYRNKLMDGFRNYSNRLVTHEYDFKNIRQEIFKEYREDLIKDLNQDLVVEVERLKTLLEYEQGIRREYR